MTLGRAVRPRGRLRTALAAAVVATAIAASGCGGPPAAPAAFERPPAPVRVAAAVARDVPLYLEEIGRVRAAETVTVRPEVTGRVTEARFVEGADVRRGDVLFTIDVRPFQARLDAAEATLLKARADHLRAQTATQRPQASIERARAARDLAQIEFSRVEALIEAKAVSRADFDAKAGALRVAEAELRQAEADLRQAEPELARAEADVKHAEAQVAMARLDVERCEVRAQIDGRAGSRLVDAGNVVVANDSALVVVERIDPVHVDFTVAESSVLAVQRHLRAGSLRVEIRLPDAPEAPQSGELTFLDNAVQPGTGTLRLRAALANADRHLWPGRFVQVRLILSTLPGAVLVPAGAEQLSAMGTFVYVVTDDGTAEMRPVKLGQRHGDLVVVTEGVRAGDRVVVEGQFAVTPGGKVLVSPDETAAAAEPAR